MKILLQENRQTDRPKWAGVSVVSLAVVAVFEEKDFSVRGLRELEKIKSSRREQRKLGAFYLENAPLNPKILKNKI
jgi:hypothetical protein